jgi:hypothetical protein
MRRLFDDAPNIQTDTGSVRLTCGNVIIDDGQRLCEQSPVFFVFLILFAILMILVGGALLAWAIIYCGETIAEGAANPHVAVRVSRISSLLAAVLSVAALASFVIYVDHDPAWAVLTFALAGSWIAPAALVVIAQCMKVRASRPAAKIHKRQANIHFAWAIAMAGVALLVTAFTWSIFGAQRSQPPESGEHIQDSRMVAQAR